MPQKKNLLQPLATRNTQVNMMNRSSQKKRPRRVHFDCDESDVPLHITSAPPLFETLKLETAQEIWYLQSEIASFKREARNILLYGKTEEKDELCGLERFNLERSIQKKNAVKYVMLAQKLQKGADFVKEVYRQCTTWATDLALVQGFNDFCEVYDPLKSLLGDNCAENYNDCFFSEKKRPLSVDENSFETRRVRSRTLKV